MNKFNIKNMVQSKLEESDLGYLQLIEDQTLVLPMDYTSILKHHKGDITDLEFMWYNNLELINGNYTVKDYFIPKQEVTATTCKEDSSDWKCQLYKSNCYIWGHSHVNMQPNPSPQDKKETEEQLDLAFSALEEGEHTYFIRLIMNKDTEISVLGHLIYNYKGIKITEEVNFDLVLSETSIEDVTDTDNKIKKEVQTVGYNNKHNVKSILAQKKQTVTPATKPVTTPATKPVTTPITNNKPKKYEDPNEDVKNEMSKYDGYRLDQQDWDEIDEWYGL